MFSQYGHTKSKRLAIHIHWLVNKLKPIDIKIKISNVIDSVIKFNLMKIFKELIVTNKLTIHHFHVAAGNNNLEMAKFIKTKLPELKINYYIVLDSVKFATLTKQYEFITWLFDQNITQLHAFRAAIKSNDIDLVTMLYNGEFFESSYLNLKYPEFSMASSHQDSACLEYLYKIKGNRLPKSCEILNSAAKAGSLKCLQFLFEKNALIDSDLLGKAAESGSIKCLKFVYNYIKDKIPINFIYAINRSVLGQNLKCVKFIDKLAIKNNNRHPFSNDTSKYAAECGDVEIFQYLIDNNCLIDYKECLSLSMHSRNLSCFKYIYSLIFDNSEGDYNISDDELFSFVEGNIQVIKYLRSKGHIWSENLCTVLVQGEYLHSLKYVRRNGCPWDSNTCKYAAKSGLYKNFKYAYTHGCPCDLEECLRLSGVDVKCYKYIKSLLRIL